MNKIILKSFAFIRQLFYFCKIIAVLSILLLLLYWIQNLTGSSWGWMSFVVPFLDIFVQIGQAFSNNKLELFGAVFEYKFFIALIIFFVLYYIFNGLDKFMDVLEDKYDDTYRVYKKGIENSFNKKLYEGQKNSEKKLNKYKILVKAEIKKKFSHSELGYDIKELTNDLLKVLITKLSVSPTEFEGGYLFTFSDFDSIDGVLPVFFNIIKKNVPIEIAVSVQIEGENELNSLKFLGELNMFGKIIMLSDTLYRYKFNESHRFSTSQIGTFQRESEIYEVAEFTEML